MAFAISCGDVVASTGAVLLFLYAAATCANRPLPIGRPDHPAAAVESDGELSARAHRGQQKGAKGTKGNLSHEPRSHERAADSSDVVFPCTCVGVLTS